MSVVTSLLLVIFVVGMVFLGVWFKPSPVLAQSSLVATGSTGWLSREDAPKFAREWKVTDGRFTLTITRRNSYFSGRGTYGYAELRQPDGRNIKFDDAKNMADQIILPDALAFARSALPVINKADAEWIRGQDAFTDDRGQRWQRVH